ncbi:MAG: gamma-glutamyltransferase [Pseudomonadota bacterium]|nr:gamma-glutamyltransferase [Pseudomonadota bacterium]
MLRALTAPRGMVTAPHHLAAQSGNAVLRDGGNAVEAMVAAAATIAVVYPHMNSLGGDGFWLISRPDEAPVGIDACGRAARLATPEWYAKQGLSAIPSRGPLAAITVAGALSGWQAALQHSGSKLALARLLRDAIGYAREGTPITHSQVDYTTKFLDQLAPQPGYAAAFLRNGAAPPVHSLQRFAALGNTLQLLAERGLDDYYRGRLARSVAAELQRLGSPLRLDDLQQQRAQIVTPLSLELSVGKVFNLPPPTQGLASLMILALFDRIRGGAAVDSFAHVHGLVEATKQAFMVRNRHVCDPATMTIDPADFLADSALGKRAQAIDLLKARPWPDSAAKGDTVWMGAVDAQGCMVSYIQSVYWEFGSGVVLEDTGLNWQNRGASFSLDPRSHVVLAPGRKPFHTLNPALARLSDGRAMVYGNMGGDGQPQSQAAVFSRYAMFNQDLQQAVTAPRWLLGRTWGQMSVGLKLENRFDPSVIEALRAAGHELEVVDEYSDLVGHAGAIVRHPNGVLSGAADPRSDGVVAAH